MPRNPPLTTSTKFQLRRTVRWVETDASGYVHFASYVRMMEETEYAFLRSRGLNVVLHDAKGTFGFPRLKSSVNIHQALKFGQNATVQLTLVANDGKKIGYHFDIITEPQNNTESPDIAVQGEIEVACCRFPENELPYAILIPDFVMDSLN